ncbi:hypothetical protein AX16_000949 [Volvariella volvacea WC 439]|nr:hypothetical protein AX16_000949 [Volvariella volvacea WC 439]
MFDPLNSSASVFGGPEDPPPWPTTPHTPGSPVPNLRRAVTPTPPAPDNGPTPGLYGREPQIYGQPEAGLVSPNADPGAKKYEKQDPYLKVRVTGLDRNRRDVLLKLDAQTNLSNFTGTTYRNVSRSYAEFQQFYEAIMSSNPQTIIPALPLAQTSAPTDEEDDRLVKIMLQRWITRVCEDPILIHDEDVRSFIESDFGYQPTPRPKRKTSSGFSLIRRGVPDEDEELQKARFELTKLEGQFFETAKAVDRLALARKAMATVHTEMGNKLINVATTEAHPPLGNALNKIGRTWHSLADLNQAQSISECVILGDSLGYQGMNARSARDTLQMRTGVLEEYQQAVKTTISKRRQIERLKASSNIRPERVTEALEEMEEANRYEEILAKRADGISQNLHRALQTHSRHANDDITTALIEHARSSIMYEKQLLRELEALRVDVANAAKKSLPVANGVPKPTIVPPLEDYGDSPRSAPPGPSNNPLNRPVPLDGQIRGPPQGTVAQGPATALPSQSFAIQQQQPQPTAPLPRPTQTQGAGPSTAPGPSQPVAPTKPLDEPPLGGRFGDGTKSMFVKSTTRPLSPPLPISSSTSSIPPQPSAGARGPLADPLMRPAPVSTPSPLHDPLMGTANGQAQQQQPQSQQKSTFEPLGQAKYSLMSQSVRIQQPTRPRLDAREAASKLANMF